MEQNKMKNIIDIEDNESKLVHFKYVNWLNFEVRMNRKVFESEIYIKLFQLKLQ